MSIDLRTDSLLLKVDPIDCRGFGLCAEAFPEGISLDEWGYPIIAGQPLPRELVARAREAAAVCPVRALRLRRTE